MASAIESRLTLAEVREIAKQTRITNPHGWRIEPWNGQGKRGHVRLIGVRQSGSVLLWRKAVRSLAESDATYYAVNHYLLSRKDNQGIQQVDGQSDDKPLALSGKLMEAL